MTQKEELREEYFKMHGIAAPIAKKHNERDPAIFEWICSKIEKAEQEVMLRREEVKILMRQVLERDAKISHLQSTLEAADEVIQASGDLSTYNTHHSIVEKYKDKLNAYHQLKTKSQS